MSRSETYVSCTREAPALAEQGERTMSTDELTGVQALERKHPGLPMAPGKVTRIEFEYIRHGTRSFIFSRDVVTGQLVAPFCGPTRTEADFLAHIQNVVATHPATRRWHFVTDNLDTHRSESLVRWGRSRVRPGHRSGRQGQIWGVEKPPDPGRLPE